MIFTIVVTLFALVTPLVHAIPPSAASQPLAWNAVAPRATPANTEPRRPKPIPLERFSPLFGFTPRSVRGRQPVPRNVADVLSRRVATGDLYEALSERYIGTTHFERRDLNSTVLDPLEVQAAQAAIAANCVGAWANDTYISSLFWYGGSGTTVYLCPSAVIKLTGPVFLFWPNQTLATWGLPLGATKATLVVTALDQSCAVFGAVNGANGVSLRNIQVDGARPALGILPGGFALLEMGGNTVGQVVDNVHAFEPRGWSVLHAIEGAANQCNGMLITKNQLGPSGHAPSGAQQFKRDSTGIYTPGQWADGISLACKNSVVQGNTITDATDGGVVIFGAVGSKIKGNTIVSVDRQLLGGINMVDWAPFAGSFVGTEVTGNSIIAQSTFIKLGIAIGPLVWGTDNRTAARTYGGLVTGNTFTSGPTGYFGYAIGMASHVNATVTGNDARRANFGSIESLSCFTWLFALPSPQSFIADRWTTPGCVLQSGFTFSTLALLICRGPGAILSIGGINL